MCNYAKPSIPPYRHESFSGYSEEQQDRPEFPIICRNAAFRYAHRAGTALAVAGMQASREDLFRLGVESVPMPDHISNWLFDYSEEFVAQYWPKH